MDHLKTAYNIGAQAARTEFDKCADNPVTPRPIDPQRMGNPGIRAQAQNNVARGTIAGPPAATAKPMPAPTQPSAQPLPVRAPAAKPAAAPATRPSFIPRMTSNPTDVAGRAKATGGAPF